MEAEGELSEVCLEGVGEVGQGVDWQVFSDRRGWDGSSPVEGEVDLEEAACGVPARALGPKG